VCSFHFILIPLLTLIQSATCVPNPSLRFPILAPLRDADICPLGERERWELRTRPLGCQVSTLTLLSTLTAVLGSLFLVQMIIALVVLGKKIVRCCGGYRRRRRMEERRQSLSAGRAPGKRTWLLVIFPRWDGAGRDEEGGGGVHVDERSPLLGTG
jgi:hypothetical protein